MKIGKIVYNYFSGRWINSQGEICSRLEKECGGYCIPRYKPSLKPKCKYRYFHSLLDLARDCCIFLMTLNVFFNKLCILHNDLSKKESKEKLHQNNVKMVLFAIRRIKKSLNYVKRTLKERGVISIFPVKNKTWIMWMGEEK